MQLRSSGDYALRANAVLAGGCDSPVRSGWAVGGEPFIQTRGDGAYAYDPSGRRHIDYIMAYGPLLFGHNHPALTQDLDRLASGGIVHGNTHPEEIRLAERIATHVPSMERLRFATTGTEAVMSAVRVARAYTGKSAVLRFSGNYHGHSDMALLGAGASAHTSAVQRSGIPHAATADVLIARYNDMESVHRVIGGRSDDIAAVLVEPIVGNMGYVAPVPGFLQALHGLACDLGAVLIFDEVITWLRFGVGGAQARLGIRPDMTTMGKIMGGGFPIAAFGGRAEIMAALAPAGAAFTGGTHAGNPFCVGMAHRVLDLLEAHPEYYAHMDSLGGALAKGIRTVLARHGLPYTVLHDGSVVDFKFRDGGATRNYDDALAADKHRYAKYYHEMRARGVLLPPSQNEVMFISTAHSIADIDYTLEAIDASFDALS